MPTFTHNGNRYTVTFISTYDGSASYDVHARDGSRTRIETRRLSDYPRGSLERAAMAAYQKDMHARMKEWARRNSFPNVGAALKFAHS